MDRYKLLSYLFSLLNSKSIKNREEYINTKEKEEEKERE